MNQKPVPIRSLYFSEKGSSGFIALPVLVLVAIGVALVAKTAYDKSHVLGESSLIAQVPPGETAPQPQSQPQQAPQESQPQQAPPQQESQPQPQQQSAPQPQQNQAPQPGSGGSATNPQPAPGQGGQQQYQPRNAEGQYQRYQQQGEQQRPQQYQQPLQNTSQTQNQYQGTGQGNQQGQPGIPQGQGSQGGFGQNQGQGGQQGPGDQTNQNVYTPQFSQAQYQQFQRQYEQEAGKLGFQINGSLPPQFLDRQNFPGQGVNTGNDGQNQQAAGGQNSNSGNRFGTAFLSMPPVDLFPAIQGKFNVSASTGGANINLNDPNTRIKLWGQGPNSPLTAVRSDGTQVQIDKAEIEKINAAMKLVTGSEVAQNGDRFSLKRGQVQANTNFPISFNIATKSFTVQTSGGEQEVKILPDEIAQKLLENKVFSEIQTSIVTGQEGATETQATVSLTELDKKPVYEVQGASQQKFFGFVPVSIPKTVYVSAETGDQVKVNQPFTSQLLDLISF